MGLSIVTPSSLDEWAPFRVAVMSAFGEQPKPQTEDQVRRTLAISPLDFRIGIVDGGETLGGCNAADLQLAMPGGVSVAAAGLAGVGIDPTKTGRGGLRFMMDEHLRRSKQRGHAASTLLASESGLYGQFGYGCATRMATYEIDCDHSQFRKPLDDEGTLEVVTPVAEAAELLAAIYDAASRAGAGAMSRPSEWWEIVVGSDATWLGGGPQLCVVHTDREGNADGYLLYTLKGKPDWIVSNTVRINEFVATNRMAELRLFQFATQIPLGRSVQWTHAPLDPIVRHHLVDPRQLNKTSENDLLWVRPLDVATLLESRSYLSDGELVIAIDDELFADQRGPWLLTIAEGAATVTETSSRPDLTLAPDQLGSIVLGGTRVLDLVVAGTLSGPAEKIQLLDRLMLTDRLPFNLSKF